MKQIHLLIKALKIGTDLFAISLMVFLATGIATGNFVPDVVMKTLGYTTIAIIIFDMSLVLILSYAVLFHPLGLRRLG